MVRVEDLQSIRVLSYLTEPMVKRFLDITMVTEIKAGGYVYRTGEYARYLYAVLDGKIALELEKDSSTTVVVDTIAKGRVLGLPAVIDPEIKKYTHHARAVENTKLFAWEGDRLEQLFTEDPEIGYLFMRRIARTAHSRLLVRNLQFLELYK
jgi:CRP-like cAMP-binding protein